MYSNLPAGTDASCGKHNIRKEEVYDYGKKEDHCPTGGISSSRNDLFLIFFSYIVFPTGCICACRQVRIHSVGKLYYFYLFVVCCCHAGKLFAFQELQGSTATGRNIGSSCQRNQAG